MLLEVEDLKTYFHTRNGIVRAVNGVSFEVDRGEILGIVGESGCGKSVTVYSLLGLIPQPPGRIESGRALFDGEVDLLNMDIKALRRIRGNRISMIFQDPMTSLNPYTRISNQLVEVLQLHEKINRKEALGRCIEMLEMVGIPEASQKIYAYPHEFSGGMRQRVMIAMALVTRPDLLIADEPTTALDVTVQAQILELIQSLQERFGMGVILITHDLGVIAQYCDRVNVMYAGQIVEKAQVENLFKQPGHPYTIGLQRSIPALQEKGQPLYTIPGKPPVLTEPVQGCAFADRCPYVKDYCREGSCPLVDLHEGHQSACKRHDKGDWKEISYGQG